MKLVFSVVLCMLLVACEFVDQASTQSPSKRWAAYYGDMPTKAALCAFDVVVLDGQRFDDVNLYRCDDKAQLLLGYISLAEIHPARSYHENFKQHAVYLEKNAQWGGNKVDIRASIWQTYMLNTLIPYIMQRGYDGVMIDTIDTAIALEQAKPEQYKGMQQSAIQIIREMRARYPQLHIVVNRGFELLTTLRPYIDGVIAESILVNHNLQTGESKYFPAEVTARYTTYLQALNIPVYSLDYWHKNDTAGWYKVYKKQKANGFVPYVSTPDLQFLYDQSGKILITPNVNEGKDA